jgi:hypothetical protein
MFISDGLVYLELQKTGGTHIRRLLKRYTDGEPVGKHNRLSAGYDDRLVFGSIRNPWDWYVSLWAYGVGGKGAIRARCTKRIDFYYYYHLLPKSMGKNWLTPHELVTSIYHDVIKPVTKWESAYTDSSDPKLFQEWLKLLLDSRRRFDVGEGYGFSPVSRHAGLLTYRYLRLFTTGDGIYRDVRLQNLKGLSAFDREFNITRGMIRTESLEEDFIKILEEAGYSFSEEQLDEIRDPPEGRTNISQRKPALFYHDDETIELIAERDKYLIEKYQYQAPL